MTIFGVSELYNPWTDWLNIWCAWLCWRFHLICQTS